MSSRRPAPQTPLAGAAGPVLRHIRGLRAAPPYARGLFVIYLAAIVVVLGLALDPGEDGLGGVWLVFVGAPTSIALVWLAPIDLGPAGVWDLALTSIALTQAYLLLWLSTRMAPRNDG